MRVLVAGAGGLVGTAVARHCELLGDEVFGHTHYTLDITDAELVRKVIAQQQPEAVINCAAWTDVDGCESDRERAFLINAQGPENLAIASRAIGATLVTISTDYVFDGKKNGFYNQRDDPNPESVYGLSKLEGERRAQLASAATVVVRTGFVFGTAGKNFLSTVVDRARRGERLKAISDAWGTPTHARDLAMRLRELAELRLPGIFHVVNAGEGTSFEGFTRLAIEASGAAGATVEPISMASLQRPAPRPVNSRLECLLSEAIGLKALPLWQNALLDFIGLERQAETAAPSG